MSQAIEDSVKALKEFEGALDAIKSDADEAKKKMLKSASDWAESAKSASVANAESQARAAVDSARAAAEKQAETIRSAGERDLSNFVAEISAKKSEAVNLVTKRLLGGNS